jgi:hypothetical protein
MALKGNEYTVAEDVTYFMNEVAERGGIVCISTVGSGAALDQAAALVTYAAAPSGKTPIGMLCNDMVNIDQTRQHINYHKDEVQKGGKVTLLLDGWRVTNKIYPGVTPTAGSTAYVSHSGLISTTALTDNSSAVAKVGRFLSTKDEDGYAKVYVKLPQM